MTSLKTTTKTWKSKLGNEYDEVTIMQNDAQAKVEIDRLRRLPANKICADCGRGPTVWASVNLGVFLCMTCGSHHRGIGTHISKPKGCTGTYLWGPDEIQRMRDVGNARANQLYGSSATTTSAADDDDDTCHQKPSNTASNEEWRVYLTKKYQQQRTTTDVIPSTMERRQRIPSSATAHHQHNHRDLITLFDDAPTQQSTVPTKSSKDVLLVGSVVDHDFFAEFGV